MHPACTEGTSLSFPHMQGRYFLQPHFFCKLVNCSKPDLEFRAPWQLGMKTRREGEMQKLILSFEKLNHIYILEIIHGDSKMATLKMLIQCPSLFLGCWRSGKCTAWNTALYSWPDLAEQSPSCHRKCTIAKSLVCHTQISTCCKQENHTLVKINAKSS